MGGLGIPCRPFAPAVCSLSGSIKTEETVVSPVYIKWSNKYEKLTKNNTKIGNALLITELSTEFSVFPIMIKNTLQGRPVGGG